MQYNNINKAFIFVIMLKFKLFLKILLNFKGQIKVIAPKSMEMTYLDTLHHHYYVFTTNLRNSMYTRPGFYF